MIKYALICADCEAEFDAWFASSTAYDTQSKAGLVECTSCNGRRIGKQIMAPSVRTSNRSAAGQASAALPEGDLLEATRNHIAKTHDYTGDQFPHEARAMHYGEIETRPIWGETTPKEAAALRAEGIGAVPLPAPLTPQKPKDKTKLN